MDDAFNAAPQEPSMGNNEDAPQFEMPKNEPSPDKQPQDNGMNEPMPEMPSEAPANEEGDDSTMGIINRLSDEDKEAVRSYAQSILKKQEKSDNSRKEKEEEPAPVQERIFTKGELQSLKDESIMNKRKPYSSDAPLEKRMKVSKSSPFTAPIFK